MKMRRPLITLFVNLPVAAELAGMLRTCRGGLVDPQRTGGRRRQRC
jgi:hypothetical protein